MANRRILGLGLVLAAGLLVFLWWLTQRDEPATTANGPIATDAMVETVANAPPTKLSADGGELLNRRPIGNLDRERRDALLKKLGAARTMRLRNPKAAPTQGRTAEDSPPLDLADKTEAEDDWHKRQVATLNELLGECYELARVEDPELSGRLGLQFTITAEPDVGGLRRLGSDRARHYSGAHLVPGAVVIRQNRAVPILLALTLTFILYLAGCFGAEEPVTVESELPTPAATPTQEPVVRPIDPNLVPEEPFFHTIEDGDLLASIASKYNVTPTSSCVPTPT